MALPTIEAYRGVGVATLAEMLVAADYAIVFRAGVAANAILQAVFSGTDPFMHRFVTLMQQQLHVVLAHEGGIFHAPVAGTAFIDNDSGAGLSRCAGRGIRADA